jgi:acyl-CoA thioester hydrolase
MEGESGGRPEAARPISVHVPLRWRDVDVLGHMYHGRYHELLDEARAAVFTAMTGPLGFPFVLARVELDHRREVRRADGALDVHSLVRSIGTSSVHIDHEFVLPGGEVAARGLSVMVAWDRERRTKRRVTPDERRLLTQPEVVGHASLNGRS